MLSAVSSQGGTPASAPGKTTAQGNQSPQTHESKFSGIIGTLAGDGSEAASASSRDSAAAPAARSVKPREASRPREKAEADPYPVASDSPEASGPTAAETAAATPPQAPAEAGQETPPKAPDEKKAPEAPSETPAQTAAAAQNAQTAQAALAAAALVPGTETLAPSEGVPGDSMAIQASEAQSLPELPSAPAGLQAATQAENAGAASAIPQAPVPTGRPSDPSGAQTTPIKPTGPAPAPEATGDPAPAAPESLGTDALAMAAKAAAEAVATPGAAATAAAEAADALAAQGAQGASGAVGRAAQRRQQSAIPLEDASGGELPALAPKAKAIKEDVTPDPVVPKAGLTPAQAKAALDLAQPGVKLQTKGASATDAAAPAKAALTEFLNQPKPEVVTPRILTPGTAEFTALHGAEAALPAAAAPSQATVPATTTADAALAMAAPGVAPGIRVPAPAPTQEAPPAAHPTSLVSQVEGSIKWLLKNQDQGAELQLHPASLGTVRIKLTVEGTEVHAKLWASDPAALPALNDNRAFLEASLRDQGLSLGSFNLQQGRQGEQAPQSGQGSGSTLSLPALPEVGQETPTALAPLPSDARRIEIVA